MHLSHLSIVNFKNAAESTFDFSANVNCLLGKNGQGKTNVLDAIYYLSNCKSYFNSIDTQNIKFDEPFFVVQGSFDVSGTEEKIYCGVKRGQKKTFKRNQKAYKTLAEHIGLLPVVIITPYDSNLILDGSDLRRRFLDVMIAQFDKQYLDDLVAYNKILQHRNALLKHFSETGKFQEDALFVWDMQLIQRGNSIFKIRKSFLENFIPVFNKYYQEIAKTDEQVTLSYQSALNETSFEELLKENLPKDRISTYTSQGIHKDDLDFLIADHSLKKFGSQGQQKSFLIALKLAKFSYIKEQKGFSPILLLDDIFDKLDDDRVAYLLNAVSNNDLGQTFITDTSIERVPSLLEKSGVEFKAFEIKKGSAVNLELSHG